MIRLLNSYKIITLYTSPSCTTMSLFILVCKMCNLNDKNSNPRVTTSTILLIA